jgi:hypothetical protein
MTVSYEGSLTLAQAIPMALDAQVALGDTASTAIPDVQARVDGLLALSLQPPPNLLSLIAGAEATLAGLQAMLTVPLPDAGATASALADLQVQLAELSAALAFSVSFGALLATPGIHYYLYAGRADQVGSELGAVLSAGLPGGGPAEHIAGCILLANDASAIAAMQAVMRG